MYCGQVCTCFRLRRWERGVYPVGCGPISSPGRAEPSSTSKLSTLTKQEQLKSAHYTPLTITSHHFTPTHLTPLATHFLHPHTPTSHFTRTHLPSLFAHWHTHFTSHPNHTTPLTLTSHPTSHVKPSPPPHTLPLTPAQLTPTHLTPAHTPAHLTPLPLTPAHLTPPDTLMVGVSRFS